MLKDPKLFCHIYLLFRNFVRLLSENLGSEQDNRIYIEFSKKLNGISKIKQSSSKVASSAFKKFYELSAA